jgi:hypothetical protein
MDICPSIECETDWCFSVITEFPNCINDFKVFGFIKMKYGIEVIIMACRVNASLSTTLINSSKFPLSKSQSVGLDYRALGQIAFRHRDVVHQIMTYST